MADTKQEKTTLLLPEGRLINGSLFEKDAFTDPKGREGTPGYKAEMAFDPKLIFEAKNADGDTIEDLVVFAAEDEWGATAGADYDAGKIAGPFLEGDKLAKDREAKGKSGEAYKGLTVIRFSTIFNKDGQDAPGGVYVANADGSELIFTDRGKVYNGSYGIVAVTLSPWSINAERGVKMYLQGYQFTRDGEKLRGVGVSALFKTVGRVEGAPAGRRSRKG